MILIEKRNGYVYVEYSDPYRFEKISELIREVARLIKEENQQKFLLNFLEMSGEVSIVDRFRVAVEGAKIIRSRAKFAAILRDTDDRFSENVAVNRGLNTRMFSNIPDALKWLGVELDK